MKRRNNAKEKKRRPKTRPNLKLKGSGNLPLSLDKYDWLTMDKKVEARGPRDGHDLPRSREFSAPPTFKFGKSHRFDEKERAKSPGPCYTLPSMVGVRPQYSFPKSAGAPGSAGLEDFRALDNTICAQIADTSAWWKRAFSVPKAPCLTWKISLDQRLLPLLLVKRRAR